jgi:hypothetical protein
MNQVKMGFTFGWKELKSQDAKELWDTGKMGKWETFCYQSTTVYFGLFSHIQLLI